MATINYDGVKLGQLILNQEGNEIVLLRRFEITNAGDVVTEIRPDKVSERILIANIPANILSALQEIDTWTEEKALIQWGLPIP